MSESARDRTGPIDAGVEIGAAEPRSVGAGVTSPSLTIRPADEADRDCWLRLRCALWPGADAEHREEIDRYFAGGDEFPREPWMVILAFDDAGPVGLAELSIRPYAEGCDTRWVAYLEGWYVEQRARRTGVGSRLVAAAEAWGRAQGCSEFASDAAPDNETSRRAHLALGFEEVGLVRCFRKDIPAGEIDE